MNEDMEFWAYLFDDHTIRVVGWFDMSDWQKGFDAVLEKAREMANEADTEIAFPLRGEYLEDYIEDLNYAISVRDKDEDYK